MKTIDIGDHEAAAIIATARMYGASVNDLIRQTRRDDAREQALRVRTLLTALPASDEVSRLLAAAETALQALGPAPKPRSSPAGPPATTARLVLILALTVATVLAWPRIYAWYQLRAYQASARAALDSLSEITASVERGTTSQEYLRLLMDKVRPACMNLRGSSFAHEQRLRRSFERLNNAYVLVDGAGDMWRKGEAAGASVPQSVRLDEVSTDLTVTAMQARWRDAVQDLADARQALAGDDPEGETERPRPPATATEKGPNIRVPASSMVAVGHGNVVFVGRVIEEGSNAPVADEMVMLSAQDGSLRTSSARTSADGTFGFNGLAPYVPYALSLQQPGGQPGNSVYLNFQDHEQASRVFNVRRR